MRNLLFIVRFIVLLVPVLLSGQNNIPGLHINAAASSYRLHPGNVTQTEVFIVNSPLNHDVLFSSCNTLNFIPFFISEGVYVTENGGLSWQGSDTCTGDPLLFHGGDPGIAIDINGTFILTRLGQSPFSGLYAHFSQDNGQTWSSQVAISTDDLERAAVASDAVKGSNFSGRTYAAWIKFALPFPLMVAYSDDGGQSWTAPQQINNPPIRSAGGDLAIGPEGAVYACWAGVSETSPFKETRVGFARSATGGQSWVVTENAFAMNGITGVLENKGNIRVNGLPAIAVDTSTGPFNGSIYIVTGQKDLLPAGSDPDIILYRSTDQGASWTDGIRVNQDALNNGKEQYFPSIHVDRFGAVNILYYDDRNTTSDSCDVYLSRSADGGNTWSELVVSDHRFKPEPIGGLGQGYQGDNIDLTSTDSTLWPVWMDNSTGTYQVWTRPVDFSALNAINNPAFRTQEVELHQNVPNPFYSETLISYTLMKKDFVELKVYDLMGRELCVLEKAMKEAGTHRASFTPARNLEAGNPEKGVFLVELRVGGIKTSKRMIYIN